MSLALKKYSQPTHSHALRDSVFRANYISMLWLFILLWINSYSAFANDITKKTQKTNSKLTNIQKEIAKQKSAINSISKKRKSLEQKLKKADLAVADIAKKSNITKNKLNSTKKRLKELAKEKVTLEKQKSRQELLLAKQLRAAYSTGEYDYLKLLLNQKDSSKVQRTLTYYQYLNKARIEEIDAFKVTIQRLDEVTVAHKEQAHELVLLTTQQAEQRTELLNSQKERKQTLKKLRKQLLTKGQKLNKLINAENSLTKQLKQLQKLAQAEFSLNGIYKLKRKLSWPVKGKIIHSFGTRKQGSLKWKGVMLRAPIGADVNAIHHGKVLFANWLNGYGLLTVIDHGKGYMSLYAHSQALLKSVGDRVETGEPIALSGQSGGQQTSGVYFEIRYKGKPTNPKRWCR